MLCSYMIGVEAPGSAVFNGKIPSIFRIQDYIEDAWDLGINSNGRTETGGVKGSRKYIGTPEVCLQHAIAIISANQSRRKQCSLASGFSKFSRFIGATHLN